MAYVDPYVVHQHKRRALQDFDHRLRMLLTDEDRDYVYNVLKEFKMMRDVDKLVACIKSVLDTPAKLDLLKDIRNFVPSAQVPYYDKISPYQKMAHPWKNIHMTPKGTNRRHLLLVTPQHTPMSTPKMRPKLQVYDGDQTDGTSLRQLIHSITIVKDRQEHLGFSIRGGSEHGLGIYVSDVEVNTAADYSGLEIGDQILEVNTIKFDSIASSSAVKVLTGSNRLKMAVKRRGKIPTFRSAKAKISWYDVTEKRIVDGETIDHQAVHDNPAGLGYLDGVERRINLAVNSREGQVLGFNIRGGSEFGLGVYVSRVDPGGLAEQQGLKMGDQITHCNGRSFENLTHAEAVDVMKSQKQLVLTVRDSGRFPAYKEIYAEYQWINANDGTITRTRPSGQIDSIPVGVPVQDPVSRGMFTEYMTESRVEAFAQTDDEADDSIMIETVGDMNHSLERGVQTDKRTKKLFEQDSDSGDFEFDPEPEVIQPNILIPKSSDIILSQRSLQEITPTKKKDKKKERIPKSTIAVRAMELETRKKHPELAQELEKMSHTQNLGSDQHAQDDLVVEEKKKKSKSSSLRGILFGSKSKGSKTKSATQGASVSRTKARTPLTSLSFESKGVDDDSGSAFSAGVGSQLSLKDSVNSSVIGIIEERSRQMLNQDESSAVLRHIRRYATEKNIGNLVKPLVAILDSNEKRKLLLDIRSIIQPSDLDVYDALMNRQQQESYIELTGYKSVNGKLKISKGDSISKETNGDLSFIKRQKAESFSQNKNVMSKHSSGSSNRDSLASSTSSEYEGIKVKSAAKGDNKTDFTMRRTSGQTRVYKAMVDIDFGDPPSLKSPIQENASNEPIEVALTDAQVHKSSSYNDNLYVSTSGRSSHTSGFGSMALSPSGKSIVSETSASPSPSPVYTSPQTNVIQVHQHTVVHSANQEMAGYIDLNNVDPVYERMEAPNKPDDIASQPDSIASATAGFSFLDNLDISSPTLSGVEPGHRTSTPSPPASLKSSRSDLSDSSQTREGFYAVNTSLNTSREYDSSGTREGGYDVNDEPDAELERAMAYQQELQPPKSEDYEYSSDSLRRRALGLPPLFTPPPPPLGPPPSESDVNSTLGELDEWVVESSRTIENSQNSVYTYADVHNSSGSSAGSGVVRYTDRSGSKPKTSRTTTETVSEDPSMGALEEVTVTNEIVLEQETGKSSNNNLDFFTSSTAHLPHYDPNSYHKPAYLNGEAGEEEMGGKVLTVYLDKHHKSLGISISGGSDSKNQPQIKINGIFPGGAATAEGTLKPGMKLISVDGHSMAGTTHVQAVDIIRKSFSNKTQPCMKWVVVPLEGSAS